MTDPKRPIEIDIASLERRERHLWIATLVLLFVLAVVTTATFAALVDSSSLDGSLTARALPIALVGLLVLIGLFCAYAVHAHSSFAGIRRLYQDRALRDPLTGLLNRLSFQSRFDEKATSALRESRPLAVMICDLDGFKEINDSHGHQEGDEILRLVGQRILDSTRGSDVAFRWGGDEFLVLMLPAERSGATIAARRIRDGVRRLAEELEIRLDLSVGVALYPEHSSEAAHLIRAADKALYEAKKGRRGVRVFESGPEPEPSTADLRAGWTPSTEETG